MTDSISVMLDLDELEILFNLICDELEFQQMNYDKHVADKLIILKTKLLQKRVFLLKES